MTIIAVNKDLLHQKDVLEKKMAEIRNWKRESQKDTLHELAPAVYTYCRHMVVDGDEKPMQLCPNCYTESQASVLQFKGKGGNAIYFCPRCDLKLTANH